MLVLASASPRRRQLLAGAGLRFDVRPARIDETLSRGEEPRSAAAALARKKALSVRDALSAAGVAGPAWVLGADTLVALGGEGEPERRILGKPRDPHDAAAMLRALSGSRHEVATGVCVADLAGAERGGVESTWVTMRPLAPEEVQAYVASGEWRDKAGGYAIQESADRFVTGLEGGGFDNVVGLPVALTLDLLRAAGEPQAALLAP